ncbi:MAG TPA: carboxypeptidase regulatory-like domain-containing protein [Bryobacteraceae bacterium]|nr:carboxypeptidase regulatory-like domain-containing protein [Bryobacteraceae bacterium]
MIKRKLTRYNVTVSAGLYQRGTAVPLGGDPERDPISFERSRVAVYIEGPGGQTSDPGGPVVATMEQKDRRFVPDLVVIPVGSTVSFPNLDPIFHNIFSLSASKSFDLGNYPMGETRHVTFTRPGVVALNCHLHPNMAASIVVTPNRWATRSGSDGSFVISGVPAGTYSIVAWHRVAGTFRQRVEVSEGNDASVTFVIPYKGPTAAGEIQAHR